MSRGGNSVIGDVSIRVTADNQTAQGLDAAKASAEKAAQTTGNTLGASIKEASSPLKGFASILSNLALPVGLALGFTSLIKNMAMARVEAEKTLLEFTKMGDAFVGKSYSAYLNTLGDSVAEEQRIIFEAGKARTQIEEDAQAKITKIKSRSLYEKAEAALLGLPTEKDIRAATERPLAEIAAAQDRLIRQGREARTAAYQEQARAAELAVMDESTRAVEEYKDRLAKIEKLRKTAQDDEQRDALDRMTNAAAKQLAMTQSSIDARRKAEKDAREERERKELESTEKTIRAISKAITDAMTQSANSANSQAGFTSEVVSSLQGLTQEVKRIQSNVRTVSMYSGPGGGT
jgi:hypothetical protein